MPGVTANPSETAWKLESAYARLTPPPLLETVDESGMAPPDAHHWELARSCTIQTQVPL
jgi:hypothetical protein